MSDIQAPRDDAEDIPDAWFRALTLSERLTAPIADDREPHSTELENKRLDHWCAAAWSPDLTTLSGQLGALNVTLKQLSALLVEDVPTLRRRLGHTPDWMRSLSDAWRSEQAYKPLPPAFEQTIRNNVLVMAAPLIRTFVHRLVVELEHIDRTHPGLLADPGRVLASLVEALGRRLLRGLEGVAALESATARAAAGAEKGEAWLQQFLQTQAVADASWRMLEKYPVLGRLMLRQAQDWLDSACELLRRLASDRQALPAVSGAGRGLGGLLRVESLGLRPVCGRLVLGLHFEGGQQLVYKPRGLARERLFYDLLSWLDTAGWGAPFRSPVLVDRGGWGWMAFVEQRACESPEQVVRYFQRQGAHLALAHALGARDLHEGNFIASGDQPVVIDLESCCLPSAAAEPLPHSVASTGMLPYRQRWRGNLRARPGALGLPRATQALRQEQHVLQYGPYGPQAIRRLELGGPGGSLPQWQDQRPDASDYLEAVDDGFQAAYALIVRDRSTLLAPGGHLARFAGLEVRVLDPLENMMEALLIDSQRPELLTNGLARDRLLHRLHSLKLGEPSIVSALAPLRRSMLEWGEPPHYHTSTTSLDLWSARGARAKGYFRHTGMQLLARRVDGFGAEDLERQRIAIRDAFEPLPCDSSPTEGDRHARG